MSSRRTHQCLGDTQLLKLASGKYPERRVRELLAEAESCPVCQVLLREAGRAIAEAQGDATIAAPASSRALVFRAGQLIADRYRVEGVLGCGGMGEVYRVFDEGSLEHVALKTVRRCHARRASSVQRLQQEFKLARGMTHPNLCRVLECGHAPDSQGDSAHYFTMELLAGRSLSELLQTTGPMKPTVAVRIVARVCDALAAVHGAGVLHRDVKGSNVMLCPTDQGSFAHGRVVLLDFGIARGPAAHSSEPPTAGEPPRDEPPGRGTWPSPRDRNPASETSHAKRLTASDHRLGTPLYMAPEQRRPGASLSPATDLFSVGVVLFELLAGRLPPPIESAKHDGRTLRAVKAACRFAPTGLEAVLGRCLAYDAETRPRSAAELLRQLSSLHPDASAKPQPPELCCGAR